VTKAEDRIVFLALGNAPATHQHREKARVIINELREKTASGSKYQRKSRDHLMQQVGLDPERKDDVDKFNRIMKNLKGDKDPGKVHSCIEPQFVVRDQEGNDVYYRFSKHTFRRTFNSIKKNLEDFLDTEPDQEIKELRTENEELKEKIRSLEEKVEDQVK